MQIQNGFFEIVFFVEAQKNHEVPGLTLPGTASQQEK
jgi:hypothetical protein